MFKLSSRSATVLVIFSVAVIAFCLASVFAAMTGPISILPNESDAGGILDNLSAITDSDNNNYHQSYSEDSYDYSYSDSHSDDSQVETTADDSKNVETTTDTEDNPGSGSSPSDSPSSSSSSSRTGSDDGTGN